MARTAHTALRLFRPVWCDRDCCFPCMARTAHTELRLFSLTACTPTAIMVCNLFSFNVPLHSRVLWYSFLLQLAVLTVYHRPPLSSCPELQVTAAPCQTTDARLTYLRDDIMVMWPSSKLDPSSVENSCGIGVN